MSKLDTPKLESATPEEEGLVQKEKTENEESEEEESEERDLRDLAKDIVVSYDARIKTVNEIVADTHATLDQFKEKREQMSKDLREGLAGHESLRKKDFDRMMADIVRSQNEREREVREMLDGFRQGEEIIGKKIRQLLEKGERVRIRDFKKMMAEIRQEQNKKVKETSASITEQVQKMQEEVHTMLDNFKTERRSVAGAWREMLTLFHNSKKDYAEENK